MAVPFLQAKERPLNVRPEGNIRINKFLSEAGVCSRREADRLIENGEVTVDGIRAEAGMKISGSETVLVSGKPVKKVKKNVILAVNKPAGVVCTTDTRWGDPTLEQMVDYPHRVFGIGRLDKASEGLILMTDNGDIVNRMMRAENGHEKEYAVTIDRPVEESFLERMRKGIHLPDLGVRTLPCRAWKTGRCSFRIVLRQGLNRQIRRMCEALGCRVRKLVRVRIMNIELGNLPAGSWQEIGGEEKRRLMEMLEKTPAGQKHKEK